MTDTRTAAAPVAARAASGATSVPLGRLTLVELRKLADTRSGRWLLVVIGLAAVATTLILLFAAEEPEHTFRGFFTFAQLPAGILLPVLGILSMTGEWSQRTALTTFALVPARGRVVAAKLLAATLIAVAATAASAVPAAAGTAAADGPWAIPLTVVLQCVLLQVVFVLMGSAFGALLMNSPLAIVGFFALPAVWTLLTGVVDSLRDAAGWLDVNTTTLPLTEGTMTGGQWARLATSVALWVVVPLVAGTIRVLRREVS